MKFEKPMLASDWDASKVQFPLILQPKIDGVRALNVNGRLVGRSLKEHANRHVTELFSHPALAGMDGEMAAEHQCNPRLCSLTTSALNTIEGEPYVLWWLFDYVTDSTAHLPYYQRYKLLMQQVEHVKRNLPSLGSRLRIMPQDHVCNMDMLMAHHEEFRAAGFEGSIIRDPNGMYKNGRSTVREGGLLRIKDFADCEIVVTGFEEGQTNLNEAKLNELGLTERSTHQENMVPNSMVGTIIGELLKDTPVNNGSKVVPAGTIIRASAGRMSHDERKSYFQNPHLLTGRLAKVQHFPKGVKDTLRFVTFQSFRSTTDL